MWMSAVIPSSVVGGLTGFLLAQVANLAKAAYSAWTRPSLAFEYAEDGMRLLLDSVETEEGIEGRIEYGFGVRNTGRSVATGAQVFLASFELSKEGQQYHLGGNYIQRLPWRDASEPEKYDQAVILPGTTASVSLGGWQERYDGICFATKTRSAYHEEAMVGIRFVKVRLIVVADGARRREVTHVLKVG